MTEKKRCAWCHDDELMIRYHDEEWGVPPANDRLYFEHLMMEVMQCGLSWRLVLQRREALRQAFDGFDYEKIIRYTPADEDRILAVPGMIRARRKVAAIIHNAPVFKAILEEYGGFAAYLHSFAGEKMRIYPSHAEALCASNELSDRIAADLKRRGMKFIGSITVYSTLQACGIVNDHESDCWRYEWLKEHYPWVEVE